MRLKQIRQHPVFGSGDSVSDVERIIGSVQSESVLPTEGLKLKEHLLSIERNLIQQALIKAEHNVSRAFVF